MLIFALVAIVGADPEPSVKAVLDGLDEILADLVRGCLLVALLGENNRPQLLLIPVRRSFGPLFLLLFSPGICVQAPLVRLPVQLHVVGKFALLSFLAVALLVKNTQDGLRIDAKGHFLDLGGLVQQLFDLLPRSLGSQLLLLALGLFGGLLLLLGGTAALCLSLHLLDGPLGGTTLLVLHAKGLVLDDLFGVHLLGGALVALFGRHLVGFELGNAKDKKKEKRREAGIVVNVSRLFDREPGRRCSVVGLFETLRKVEVLTLEENRRVGNGGMTQFVKSGSRNGPGEVARGSAISLARDSLRSANGAAGANGSFPWS